MWVCVRVCMHVCAYVCMYENMYAILFAQTISDYKGEDQGQLTLNITPCDQKGDSVGEDFYLEDPSELLGKPYAFKVSA